MTYSLVINSLLSRRFKMHSMRQCVRTGYMSRCVRKFSSVPESEQVLLQNLAGSLPGIRVLRLNRPESRNAISRNVAKLLQEAMTAIHMDHEARVLIVKSDVPSTFCAGADLKERAKMSPQEVPMFIRSLREFLTSFAALPIVTIAALDGSAFGGGLEFALACDFRVAADTAKMGLPETKLAIIPGAGGTQRLPRLIGVSKAKEMIFTGRVLDGAEAFDIGLVNKVVPEVELGSEPAFQESIILANSIATQGPVALRCAKRAIDEGSQVDLDTGLKIEELCYAQVIPTKDRLEGLTAFREKRVPVYTGE